MSVEELSIGNELKDSFKPTSKWISNGIEWLKDIEDFYRSRASLEKEYSAKLKELTKIQFEKKAKISAKLSVGDEPQVTPGSLECASLVMWNELLTQTEAISEEKLKFGDELLQKISENISLLRSRSKNVSKRIESIDDYLVGEREKVEQEVNKAKKAYDVLCQSTEGARQKVEKSSTDRHQKKLGDKEVDMNIGKNDYLIKINMANRLKDKYYFQDVPELLDYFQELNEGRVSLLNKLLKNASIIERNSNDRIKEKLHTVDATIDQNNPKLDTAMFIKHNATEWSEPPDFYFIPSSIWHDDESLITKEPELTELKRRVAVSSNEYSKYENQCLDLKQKLEESIQERKKDRANITLKFDSSLIASLSLLERFMQNDTKRVRSEVEVEIIQNFAGDKDLSYSETHSQKKSKFGFLRGKKHSSISNEVSDDQSLHTVKSATSHHTFHSGIFNLRKNKETTNASSPFDGGPTGKALYPYTATGDDEVSLEAGESFKILDEDDGSGWTMVQIAQGSSGLVPSSYIEISRESTPSGKKKGPSVAPKKGARRVQYLEALYDYEADGDDELSVKTGDRIILIQEDTDGSGWTEGELDGERGLFPTSYAKKV
ncbi:uncharacterized protein PRCAT00001955001 [Priceomyces carsonii]|uniref:uncharacterized protein n=1 Tax=Priceomyces carsonii TaxID=28549 RepID=UPI002EDB0255|nr:unnamed protein product [Priceomyces carsonii]